MPNRVADCVSFRPIWGINYCLVRVIISIVGLVVPVRNVSVDVGMVSPDMVHIRFVRNIPVNVNDMIAVLGGMRIERTMGFVIADEAIPINVKVCKNTIRIRMVSDLVKRIA